MVYDAGSRIDLILLSFAVAVVSVTLTRSHLTKTWRLKYLHTPYMLGELINCPYCMAHWVALGFSLWLGGRWHIVLVNALVMCGLASLVIGFMLRLWLWTETEIEEMRGLLREAQTELEKHHGTQDKAA